MSSVWDDRAEAYRQSSTHREGPDLDLLIELCEPGIGVGALDVATGGGHVARRLRGGGCTVTTTDASSGMQPDIVCPAERLPFTDGSFDVVASRYAAHHFDDMPAAVRELARVTRDRVVVQDMLYGGEAVEEAEKLRDASHVRTYDEAQWRAAFESAGLTVDRLELVDRGLPLEEWLARTGCEGDTAERVRQLLADRTADGAWRSTMITIRGRKS